MLHIHNGDSSANTLKESRLEGEHLPWREALIAGPTPGGLNLEEWIDLRASHLADSYGGEVAKYKKELRAQEDSLLRSTEQDEVILWFEHDLFCQTNLLYLLDWFGKHEPLSTSLSLVCIGEFPGIEDFRGLGQLTPEQMASLFIDRQKVSDFSSARDAWRAYCSPDPQAIESLLGQDMSQLPFLRNAFSLHLERFPSTRNGLGRIENIAIDLINRGFTRFPELFAQFGKTEPVYGLGDSQFWNFLREMSVAREPLIQPHSEVYWSGEPTTEQMRRSAFSLTPLGQDVLEGNVDAVELNGIDRWLGGVQLSEQNLWRWDEETKQLIRG